MFLERLRDFFGRDGRTAPADRPDASADAPAGAPAAEAPAPDDDAYATVATPVCDIPSSVEAPSSPDALAGGFAGTDVSAGSCAGEPVDAPRPPAADGIHLSDVHFAYASDAPEALCGVTLDIDEGSFTTVIGANGSGKSTLAKLAAGLLVPTGGTAFVDGLWTGDPSQVVEVRKKVGMVFQNPDNQAVATLVHDDVAFGPENLGLPAAEVNSRVDEALATVAMSDYAECEVHTLSGGQKQRVAIAGALAMHPDVLVLDEPGAMLDVRGRRGIARVAHELSDRGMTVIFVTHFMDDALSADRVVVMDAGRVALQGAPDEVFSAGNVSRLEDLRLALPFSLQVATDLSARGVEVAGVLSDDALADELSDML